MELWELLSWPVMVGGGAASLLIIVNAMWRYWTFRTACEEQVPNWKKKAEVEGLSVWSPETKKMVEYDPALCKQRRQMVRWTVLLVVFEVVCAGGILYLAWGT